MARIKWPRLDNGYVPRVRGVFLGYPHPLHGFLARAWPRKRGRQKPSVIWNNAQYALTAILSTSPNALDYETAVAWSKGIDYTWRDLFIQQMRGGVNLSQLVTSDGVVWQRLLCMSDNPQALLDLIDDTVGAMLYRNSAGWNALAPGHDGYVLTMVGGVPLWVPTGIATGLGMIGPPRFTNQTANTFTAGFVGVQAIRISQPIVINKISFWVSTAAATAQMTPVVYKLTPAVSCTLAGSGGTVTGATVGKNTLNLTSGVSLNIGDIACIGILNRVANLLIYAEASQPALTLAYNTNNTPPAGPTNFAWGTAQWAGFYGEN
jgi:hypothetical protein